MKNTILMIAVVVLVGCSKGKKEGAALEAASRKAAGTPTGELAKDDFRKFTRLNLSAEGITNLAFLG